ncbi:archaetidylserine decarboxylase [Marinibactrum halimedae]|uniref:Phosphatidylserine decarboxylase proenzyme n=1 Tax=Marinibactrum halimedae TaxID=1444977 RepID=A0AA37T0H7_9GAMM|nr:archaetidylserine decarboxylase [Marinibactrum halimedae]MCD9459733.1 archaetidylserine decarboxylase [Marinibactrum halimedae]GLS24510.1 hypothetical protein GCM10007877_02220 [Marinibactrum halimedae]
MNEKLFAALQYFTPQTTLSRAAGWMAETHISAIKNPFTRWFVKQFDVNMSEAVEEDPTAYPSFNAFFTRELKEGARPFDSSPHALISPADGAISQIGAIESGRIFQAKGQSFTASELVGGNPEWAKPFNFGQFSTIYLSPKDYHRVHMPIAGTLKRMVHIPGDLFSVNNATANQVPRLFARNERVACFFDTEYGEMVMVLVGAMIVASIETVWAGLVTPQKKVVRTWDYESDPIHLEKGAEMGRFKLGSTVVMLFEPGKIDWCKKLEHGSPLKMGETIANKIIDQKS